MPNRRTLPLVLFALALILGITAGLSQRRASQRGRGDFMTEWSHLLATPFLAMSQGTASSTRCFFGFFRLNSSLRSENKSLRRELLAVRQKMLVADEAQSEVSRLSKLLDIQREPPTKKILARILIRPSTPWGETCTIGVGKLQGVIPGAAVFAGAGLVGQVFRVTQSSSQVLLLRDHRNAVDSFTQRTRTAGICSGQTDELLRMDYISPDADVKSGDVVISSGQGGVFPKGIRIGTIVRIRNDAARHFQTADVRPSVEFRSLEEAFVVVNR